MTETYILDWPSFSERSAPAGWQPRTSVTAPMDQEVEWGSETYLDKIAELIKDYARGGKTVIPAIPIPVESSELFVYVTSKLLWDPFLDTNKLVREFWEGTGGQPIVTGEGRQTGLHSPNEKEDATIH